MYTVLENARIVLALLKKHNIRHIVLSPGGSNIPIVQGVQQDPFFKCYSVVDERSAMYFAIGLHLQTSEIIATSCTSAQATRNYIPGLTEAYYKHVPILAITMSKHPRYLGQDYMQCPIQTSLPIDAVRKSFSLPIINTEHDRAQCVRTANEAILEVTHHGNGPVQLNIEELDSETWCFDESITNLPDVRAIKRYEYWDELDPNDLNKKKVMILIGEHVPFSDSEREAIERFANSHDVFIYSNHPSNYKGQYSLNANLAIITMSSTLFEETYKPNVVISIGGLTGDYGIYGKLFTSGENDIEHWRVDRDGKVVDTYGKITRVFEMRIEDFFNRMISKNANQHSYFKMWKSLQDSINYDVELPLSNLYAALHLSKLIPANSTMTYAIHNSLRVWNYVQIENSIKAFSPIAAFGIDGGLSTSIGLSVATKELNFLITGDLAYLYDMNALSIRHINKNFRILLCNNNGGFEFKGGNLQTKTDIGSYISADNQFKNSKGWAETNGFKYIEIHKINDFKENISEFVSESEVPIMIELFTTTENERTASSILLSNNWHGTEKETKSKKIKIEIKQAISAIVGDEGIKIIKKALGKS